MDCDWRDRQTLKLATSKQQHQGLKNEANVEVLDGSLRLQKQVNPFETTG